MSTREDVARMAGVSGATVSYVLNNTKRVTPQVRERVLEAASTLGYRPNLIARSLVMKQTMHVALLVDNLMNPYYGQIAEGVQSVASQYGYLVSSLAVNVSNRASLLELTSRGVDGILFAVGSHDIQKYVGDHLSVPYLWGSEAPSYRKAIFDMVRCLKEKGHERIAFLSGMPVEWSGHYRYHYFVEALRQEGWEYGRTGRDGSHPGAACQEGAFYGGICRQRLDGAGMLQAAVPGRIQGAQRDIVGWL